jgi:hypothetical protein
VLPLLLRYLLLVLIKKNVATRLEVLVIATQKSVATPLEVLVIGTH